MNALIRHLGYALHVLAAGAGVLLALVLTAVPALAVPSTSGWQLPLPGSPPMLRLFDPPAEKWGAGHRGVDLAAAPGTDVLAAGPGVVAFSGPVGGRGVVTVRHGALRTTYEPVRGTVAVGSHVRGGAVIGRLEPSTHCGQRSCLHWGLLRGEEYLDPLSLVRPGPSRLLPVWGVPWGAPTTASPRPPARRDDQGARQARSTASGSPRSEPPEHTRASAETDQLASVAAAVPRHPLAAGTALTPLAAGVVLLARRHRRVRRLPHDHER